MNIQDLRQATEADHRDVEGSVPLMHFGLTTAQYVHTLRRIYGVVAAWEERAQAIAPDWLRPALIARQRKHLLQQDLAWFNATDIDPARPALPEMNHLPDLFGAMYVMEGSTLGGQLIARHVETVLPLKEGQGSSFFRGHGTQTGPLWKEFCEMLKQRIPDDQTDVVVISAKAMFHTFGTWMRREAAIDGS